jgi:hypothetical protein
MRGSIFFAITLSVLAACTPEPCEDSGLQISWSVSPDPPRMGPSTLTLELLDASGAPVSGARLEVEANMNHAGMVPVFGSGEERAPGTYVAPLEFTMGGDWFVLVDATLADGQTIREMIDLPRVLIE